MLGSKSEETLYGLLVEIVAQFFVLRLVPQADVDRTLKKIRFLDCGYCAMLTTRFRHQFSIVCFIARWCVSARTIDKLCDHLPQVPFVLPLKPFHCLSLRQWFPVILSEKIVASWIFCAFFFSQGVRWCDVLGFVPIHTVLNASDLAECKTLATLALAANQVSANFASWLYDKTWLGLTLDPHKSLAVNVEHCCVLVCSSCPSFLFFPVLFLFFLLLKIFSRLWYDWSKVFLDSLLVERRTRDRKVANSSPGRSSGRISISRVNFVCWILFGVHSTPCCHSGT